MLPGFLRRKADDATPTEPAGTADAKSPDPKSADANSRDQSVGVPPFRSAPSKEATAMSRPPFPAANQPASASAGAPAGAMPSASAAGRANPAQRPAVERRTLVVGHGIAVHGNIQDAERLVVEGVIESAKIEAAELAVALGGVFRGEGFVEDADIAGVFDGTITARGTLTVRATGRVIGVARCARLQVEDGGQISGQIEMITAPDARAPDARAPAAETTRPDHTA